MNDQCIICYNNTDIHINCFQCSECQICYDCYFKIYESSCLCPICRSENWEVEKINFNDIISFIKLRQAFESFFIFFDFYFYYKKHISDYWNRIYD